MMKLEDIGIRMWIIRVPISKYSLVDALKNIRMFSICGLENSGGCV